MVNIGLNNFATVSFKANVMAQSQAKHIDNVLHSGKSVDIFCHSLSDEDTFNSATTFYNYLKDQGLKPRIIASGGSGNYGYDIQKYNILQAKDVSSSTQKSDVALCVDFSSKDRLSPNVIEYLNKYNNEKIVGIDHHDDKNKIHPSFNQITKVYEKNQVPKMEPKNYYIDSSARSNCGIVYRFFEALGVKPNKVESKAMLVGMMDDLGKNTSCLDKNTKEIKKSLMSKLSAFDLFNISRHFSEKNNFNKSEKKFVKGLEKRTQYTQNGKMAYIEIEKNDEEWSSLGKNTGKTTTILNNFRKNLLKTNKNLEAVAVFYPCDDEQTYKMSILSNKDYSMQIVNYNKQHYDKNLVSGGHLERCGGTLISSDANEQKHWVNNFIKSAENIKY